MRWIKAMAVVLLATVGGCGDGDCSVCIDGECRPCPDEHTLTTDNGDRWCVLKGPGELAALFACTERRTGR